MTALTDYIQNRDNLAPLSLYVTLGILFLLFILMHLFGYERPEKLTEIRQRMEVREVMKMSFKPVVEKRSSEAASASKSDSRPNAQESQEAQPERKPLVETPDVSELIKGFNADNLIKKSTSRRKVSSASAVPSVGVNIPSRNPNRNVQTADFNVPFSARSAARPSGRQAAGSSGGGASVEAGASSRGSISGTASGVSVSGRSSSRTTRSSGTGTGGAKIGVPGGSTGDGLGEGAIDLNALIEWMKKNPGAIPKLVAHEMDHERGDLSSAVHFTANGKKYTFFISCNEEEMLLRVCLVDQNDFILLKDKGLTEQSNYLTTGDVMRNGNLIQSLISAREAPGAKANEFYSLFWSWWQTIEK